MATKRWQDEKRDWLDNLNDVKHAAMPLIVVCCIFGAYFLVGLIDWLGR